MKLPPEKELSAKLTILFESINAKFDQINEKAEKELAKTLKLKLNKKTKSKTNE